jgi:hypothetical protein
MAGGEEERPFVSGESSSGGTSRTAQSSEDLNQRNKNSNDARRRNRPGRAERERHRRKQAADVDTSNGSYLNPSAAEFIPRQSTSYITPSGLVGEPSPRGEPRSGKGRPHGGRRGRTAPHLVNGKGKENVPDDSGSQIDSPNPRLRPRRNPNARLRIPAKAEPEVLKESENLMLRMTDALNKGDYDCSICTDRVCHPYVSLTLDYTI